MVNSVQASVQVQKGEKMEKKKEKEEFDPVKLFREMMKDRSPMEMEVVPGYRVEHEPFWGDGSDNDIFKAHPEALKAIPYRPRRN